MQPEDVKRDDVVQVVMLGALFPAFREWIAGRGLVLQRLNEATEDDLVTFGIAIGPELAQKMGWRGVA